jgi:hypothetical protein
MKRSVQTILQQIMMSLIAISLVAFPSTNYAAIGPVFSAQEFVKRANLNESAELDLSEIAALEKKLAVQAIDTSRYIPTTMSATDRQSTVMQKVLGRSFQTWVQDGQLKNSFARFQSMTSSSVDFGTPEQHQRVNFGLDAGQGKAVMNYQGLVKGEISYAMGSVFQVQMKQRVNSLNADLVVAHTMDTKETLDLVKLTWTF